MRALIVRPKRNRPGRHDYTGAFRPESQAFASWLRARGGWTVDVLELDDNAGELDRLLERMLAPSQASLDLELTPPGIATIDRLAFFCHGTPRGVMLAGLRVRRPTFARFLEQLERTLAPTAIMTFYACSAGAAEGRDGLADPNGGDGGWADELRDAFVRKTRRGVRVDAHATVGHTTRNPYVRRFEGELAGVGGNWIVRPGSPLWRRWALALRGDLRWEFPELDTWQIHERLAP